MSKKSILFTVAAVLIMGGSIAAALTVGTKPKTTPYTYVTAEKRTLREEVRASGAIIPSQNVDLSFQTAGRIARVNVKINDVVKTGDPLMELDNAAQAAQVAQARAMIDQKNAGATPADIAVAQAAADAAQADLEKTKADAASTIATAQSALDTAQNNLKLAEGGEGSQVGVAGVRIGRRDAPGDAPEAR